MKLPNKFNGYGADGRRLYNMGGGGGPNTTYSQTSNIPEYARPYVEQMLGATQKQLFTGTTGAGGTFTPTGFNQFTPYGATYQRDAQGNPLRDAQGNVMYTNTAQQQAQSAVAPLSVGQQQAIGSINQYVAPGQTGGASQIAGNVAGRTAAAGYYSPLQAERFQLGAPQQVRTDSFTAPYVSQAYMSPYMQNVVNVQQREAQRQSNIARQQQQAQAVGQGAFGGSRQGIVEAERQRNLANQLGDIQAQGLQGAYQQGMGQFNAEQAAYLQAQQANQGTNLQAAIQNMQAQQQAQAAQEASRQFGAQLGLQGYGQSLQAAQTLGSLGQQQYQQDLSTIQAMAGLGAQEQAQTQNIINQAMQNYATQQQYPLMQLGVMSNMLRGLPMQSSTTNMYQAQPSMISQAAGALGTGLGLYQQGQKAGLIGGKEGGVVKMAAGGIATGVSSPRLEAMLKRPSFSDADLQKKAGDPQTDQATKDLVAAEMARRAGLRAGMANGGIIAFKEGKEVEDEKRNVISRGIRTGKDVKRLQEDAKADMGEGEDMLARAEEEQRTARIEKYLREDAEKSNTKMGKDITAAAQSVSPVRSASAAPDASTTEEVSAFTPVALGNAPNMQNAATAMRAGQGIAPVAPDNADARLEEYLGVLQSRLPELEQKKNLPTKEAITAIAKERKDAGIPDLFQVEKKKLEERKLRGEQSEQETAKTNLIRFLTKWGTIPGSTMRGLIGAGAELVDKMDLDEKQKQKFLNELDDIDSRINKEEYSRRIGDEDRARRERNEAGKQYFELAEKIADVRAKEALKDKDVRKAIEVEMLKIKREEAKGPKGEEYMVGVYSRGLTASDPEKYPPGPATDAIAAKAYMRDKPGVQSTAMTLPLKATELDIKKQGLELEKGKAELEKEKAVGAAGKTAAETKALEDKNVKAALRLKSNREAIAEAEEKGGPKAKAAKVKEIEEKTRLESRPKPKAAAPATSVRSQADAILGGGS